MTLVFPDLIAGARFDNDALSLTLPADWMQGRTTYGGMSVALCLETALRAFPGAPPLRSAMVSFIGPAGGAVAGRARLLRQGKSVTFVEADLLGEKGLATRCVFAFGGARVSQWNRTFTPAPDVPPPEECGPFIPPAQAVTFGQHFDTRLAKGGRPISGSMEHDHFIWVRHRDERASGMVALLALADLPPPALVPMFTQFAPISSMTWMVNILTDAPATTGGWWLLESRAEHARDGYTSQDMLGWNADGELVIAGRQSVAIFS